MSKPAAQGPVAAGLGVFVTGLVYGSTWAQRGMTADQVAASEPGPEMLLSGAAGLIAGFVLWLVFRRKPGSRSVPVDVAPDAPRLLVDDQVRVAWTGHSRISWALWAVLGVGVLSMLIPIVQSLMTGSWSMAVFMLLAAALIAVAGSAMAATVTVNVHGVQVKALRRFSLATIPWSGIAGATVMPVSPLRDFGGWGSRLGLHGEQGIITAGGSALRIDRGAEGIFVITVMDAETAAAAVNTLVTRRNGE